MIVEKCKTRIWKEYGILIIPWVKGLTFCLGEYDLRIFFGKWEKIKK